jgi:hypothetical protein
MKCPPPPSLMSVNLSSDVDLFLYGLDDAHAVREKAVEIFDCVQRCSAGTVLCTGTYNTVTIVSERPQRCDFVWYIYQFSGIYRSSLFACTRLRRTSSPVLTLTLVQLDTMVSMFTPLIVHSSLSSVRQTLSISTTLVGITSLG